MIWPGYIWFVKVSFPAYQIESQEREAIPCIVLFTKKTQTFLAIIWYIDAFYSVS